MTPVHFDDNVPGTLRKIALLHADKVLEVTAKTPNYRYYDVAYRHGWKSGSDPLAVAHSDYESTVKEIAARIWEAVPCDCDDCVRGLSGVSK